MAPHPATPTNHTTGALFAILLSAETDESEVDLEEQSSIEQSTLMEASTHTSSVLGPVGGQPAASQHHRTTHSSTLASVLEEKTTEQGLPAQPPTPHNSDPTDPGSKAPLHEGSTTVHSATFSTATSMGVTTMPSETLHTSNIDPHKPPLQTPYKRFDDHSYGIASGVVHMVLGIFCTLVLVAVLLAFVVITRYGLLALVGISLLVCFAIFLVWFVDQTVLSTSTRIRPIRTRFLRVMKVAQQILEEEYELFKKDWREELMLTNGETVEEVEEDTENKNNDRPPRKRSVIFKIIKPVFGIRKRLFRRKRRRQQQRQENYDQPPMAGLAVAV